MLAQKHRSSPIPAAGPSGAGGKPLAAICWVGSDAEVIDRIAVTVDARVITQSELLRQIRLIVFQNGEEPDYSKEQEREIAGKLAGYNITDGEVRLQLQWRFSPSRIRFYAEVFQ